MAHRILFRKDTPYQRITVAENPSGTHRYLYSSGRDEKQGGMYLDNPSRLYFEYCRLLLVSLAFLDREPRDMLFVGLGAGSLPSYIHRHFPSARVDVAELDGEVVEVAKRFFRFREDRRMKVCVSDGRSFLRSCRRSYDIVFLDAYQVNDIPYHLSTLEFLREVRDRLSEGGVAASNIVGPEKNPAFGSMVATYKRAFPHIYVFEGMSSYNNVVVASTRRVSRGALARRALLIQRQRRLDVRLHKMVSRPFRSPRPRGGEKVLRDAEAPGGGVSLSGDSISRLSSR